MNRSFRHKRNTSKRKELRRNGKLSERELDADENHDILRELKKEVEDTKELQRKWEKDKYRAEVDKEYRYHARQIVIAAEKLRKRLDLPLECVAELKAESKRQRERERQKDQDIVSYSGEPKSVRDSSRPNSGSGYHREPPLNDRNRHSTRSDNYREPVASDRHRQGSRSDYPGEVHVFDASREILRLDYQRYPSREKSSIEYQQSQQDFEPREDTEDMERKRRAASPGSRQSAEPKRRRSLNEVEELRRKLAEVEAERDSLKVDLKNIQDASSAEKRKLEDDIQKLQNERKKLQSDYQQLQGGREAESNGFRAENQSLLNENNGLKMKLDENNKQQTDLHEKIKEIEKKYAESQQELAKDKENEKMTEELLTENNGLKMALAENKKQQSDLQWKLKDTEQKYHGSQQELAKNREQFKENEKMTEELIHQSEQYQRQIEGLQLSLQRYSNTEKEMKKTIDKLQSNLYVEQSSKQEALTSLQRYSNTEKEMKKTIDKLQSNLYVEQSSKQEALTRVTEQEQQIGSLHSSLQRYMNAEEDMRNTIDKLQSNLSTERASKEEALTRLSAFAGNKLRDNNPGITDLSDPNRPMKLAEKVSELYDNEWTNAMENLEDLNIDEETGIKILLDLFMEVYTVCRDSGQSQLDPILSGHHLVFPDIDDLRDSTADVQLQKPDTDLSKPMKDYRKQYSEMADRFIAEVLKKRLEQKEGFTKEMVDACEKYLYSCVKYAWMMVVQDPPVYMEWQFNNGDQFDNNRLRSYTKGGKHVDFVVWPVLYLHKGGPLLSKGVAQGMK